MNANELRMGNLVRMPFLGNEYLSVAGLALKDNGDLFIQSKDKGNSTYFEKPQKYAPIPITKEWLLKFGLFESHSYYIVELTENRHDKKDFFTVLVQGEKYEVILRNWELAKLFLITEIKYVHQLQNLYHAISGKELSIIKI